MQQTLHDRTRSSDEAMPLYEQINAKLSHAISMNDLPAGRILKASVIARTFATSREPALRALEMLVEHGHITRSDRQGYVVSDKDGANVAPSTIVSHQELVRIVEPVKKLSNSERIYHDVEQELIRHAAMGAYQLNSTRLSDHFGVSRTVGNELIRTLVNNGIVVAAQMGKPVVPQFSEDTIRNNNEVRLLLEPYALLQAMQRIPPQVVERHLAEHKTAAGKIEELSFLQMSRLEIGLHETLLSHCANDRLIEMLRICSIALKFNSIYFKSFGPRGNFVGEHIEILEAIAAQNGQLAKLLLEQHITKSTSSTISRLNDFRARAKLEPVDYLSAT